MAKFCYRCGNPLREGATFCGKCGSVVMHEPAADEPAEQPGQQQSVPAAPEVREPVPQQPVYQQPVPQQPVYQQPVQQQMYQQPVQQPVYQQPVQQPMYQQPVPQQPMYQQPAYPLTQQLAQQAYMAQMQPQGMIMAPPKPQRYIPLRVILILICAALLFCGWRWGIKNVQNAMRESSMFTTPPYEENEDPAILQNEYDRITAQINSGEITNEDDGFGNTDFIADWIYRERN